GNRGGAESERARGSSVMSCRHKTIDDYSKVSGIGSRFWTCSDCGAKSVWGPKWAYYGSIECRSCGREEITHVSCGCRPQTGRPR
ncbi:MAG TPA: hypothetical protein VM487_17805, partial [Phycisphaerae bacterium]|nr:hypothetical protein [Phycisphaerae bacterium]